MSASILSAVASIATPVLEQGAAVVAQQGAGLVSNAIEQTMERLTSGGASGKDRRNGQGSGRESGRRTRSQREGARRGKRRAGARRRRGGPQRARAVANFQRGAGLPADGWVGPRTLDHIKKKLPRDAMPLLMKNCVDIQEGRLGRNSRNSRRLVRDLQQAIGAEATGEFDQRTEQKLMAFQDANGLASTGQLSPESLAAIVETSEFGDDPAGGLQPAS